jgi:hypothetical protein
MKKLVLAAVIVCAGLGVTMKVRAGYKATSYVIINGLLAEGSLADARSSSDDEQWLGCSTLLDLNSGGTESSVSYQCFARNSAGTQLTCTGSDSGVANWIGSQLKGDSYLQFTANSNGTCAQINIANDSQVAPKEP